MYFSIVKDKNLKYSYIYLFFTYGNNKKFNMFSKST